LVSSITGDLIALGTQSELTRQVGEYESLQLHLSEMDDSAGLAQALRGLEGVVRADVIDHNITLITRMPNKFWRRRSASPTNAISKFIRSPFRAQPRSGLPAPHRASPA
jgi:muconolactone delta-isomerase